MALAVLAGMLSVVEHHRSPIYAVAFNQTDEALAHHFATIGSNCVTLYQIKVDAPSIEEPGTEGEPPLNGKSKANGGKKRKRRKGTVSTEPLEGVVLEAVQHYRDEDEDEKFYCCDFSVLESDGSALVAVAGEQRQIKAINCRTGTVHSVLQGHGAAVYDVSFHPLHPSLLFSGSADESIRLWHVLSRDCIAVFAGSQGHRDAGEGESPRRMSILWQQQRLPHMIPVALSHRSFTTHSDQQ